MLILNDDDGSRNIEKRWNHYLDAPVKALKTVFERVKLVVGREIATRDTENEHPRKIGEKNS